jgi:hypothetical protein
MPSKDAEFWSAAGITFSVANHNDRREVKEFLFENFFPDEPIIRCQSLFTATVPKSFTFKHR